jgi:hypothetical protein
MTSMEIVATLWLASIVLNVIVEFRRASKPLEQQARVSQPGWALRGSFLVLTTILLGMMSDWKYSFVDPW